MKKVTIAICGLIFSLGVFAQEKQLPQIIMGEYIVEGTQRVSTGVIVKEGSKLILAPGSQLLFDERKSIRLEGALEVQGTASNKVRIASSNPNASGVGFTIVEGNNQQKVEIRNAEFTGLRNPLVFEKNWVRESVVIENNVFQGNVSRRAVVEIQNVDAFNSSGMVPISVANNTFTNNTGNLFVSNLVTPEMRVEIKNNVFTRNQYFNNSSESDLFNNPIFVRYNEFGQGSEGLISGNAIFDNFNSNISKSNPTSERVSINTVGNGDIIDLNSNYFGAEQNEELNTTYDRISTFYQVPLIQADNASSTPSADLPAHYYIVKINGDTVQNDEQWLNVRTINTMGFTFNKAMDKQSSVELQYNYYDGEKIQFQEVQARVQWSEDGKSAEVITEGRILESREGGFYVLDGFKDEQGYAAPMIAPGKKRFAAMNSLAYSPSNTLNHKTSSSEELVLIPDVDLNSFVQAMDGREIPVQSLIDSDWEVGVFAGVPMYFGDLFVDFPLTFDPRNANYAVGPRVHYNRGDSPWSFGLAQTTMLLEATENTSTQLGRYRGTGYDRNLSFRSMVYDLALTVHYDFKSPREVNSWIFGLHGGANGFYFNPQGEYQGKWYDLRDIGTEGQTIGGKDERYSLFNVGGQLGLHLKNYLSENLKLEMSYTHSFLATDYLDDASRGLYPSDNEIREANPDNPDAAAYLSNPGGWSGQRTTGPDNDAFSYWGAALYINLDVFK